MCRRYAVRLCRWRNVAALHGVMSRAATTIARILRGHLGRLDALLLRRCASAACFYGGGGLTLLPGFVATHCFIGAHRSSLPRFTMTSPLFFFFFSLIPLVRCVVEAERHRKQAEAHAVDEAVKLASLRAQNYIETAGERGTVILPLRRCYC